MTPAHAALIECQRPGPAPLTAMQRALAAAFTGASASLAGAQMMRWARERAPPTPACACETLWALGSPMQSDHSWQQRRTCITSRSQCAWIPPTVPADSAQTLPGDKQGIRLT